MKNKTMGGLSAAVMLLLNSSQAEAHTISSWRAKAPKNPDTAKDNALLDMGQKLSTLSLSMLNKDEANRNNEGPATEEMLQIHSDLYLDSFEQVFAKVYQRSRGDDVDSNDIMAYSAMGADTGADEEPAFGAGGAIMEALAQSESDADVSTIKQGKNLKGKSLKQEKDTSTKTNKNKTIKEKEITKDKEITSDVATMQVDEDIKKNLKPVSIGEKLSQTAAKKADKTEISDKQLLAEHSKRTEIAKAQSKEEKELESQIKKEQDEAINLQKEMDNGKTSREQAMLDSFAEGDEIEQKERDNADKDYLSKGLTHKRTVLQMAADSFDVSNESASSMIGKAKKNVFKNLLNF